jgi:hypothetical protein
MAVPKLMQWRGRDGGLKNGVKFLTANQPFRGRCVAPKFVQKIVLFHGLISTLLQVPVVQLGLTPCGFDSAGRGSGAGVGCGGSIAARAAHTTISTACRETGFGIETHPGENKTAAAMTAAAIARFLKNI